MSSEVAAFEFALPDWQKAKGLSEGRILNRIERLFAVYVSVHGEWISVRGALDSAIKAKKYILSVCAPVFQTEVRGSGRVSHLLFGESTALRDELERDYQTFIQPSQSGIRVQGSEHAVGLTVSRLTRLIETMDSGVRLGNESSQPFVPPPVPSSLAQPSSSSSSKAPTSLDWQLRDIIQKINSKLPEEDRKALLRGLEEDLSGELVSRDSSVYDTQREQKIQYFVTLDYPREKVEAVLTSLGPEASDNDVLSRLVKVCSRRPLSDSRPRGFSGELLQPSPAKDSGRLRPIVIDGSNIAMRHGNGRVFSCKGILLAVQWFFQRGHRDIKVFVPSWRKEASQPESPISDQEILLKLERDNYLVFTPSRKIGQKRIVCYDDRFIVRLATINKGVIVSNDTYRDLVKENPEWKETIEKRLVMFAFAGDLFMVPDDPQGRRGTMLNELLQLDPKSVQMKGASPEKQQEGERCPYGDRCTFGRRCRYYHPEREARQTSGGTVYRSRSPSRSATPSPAPVSSTQSSREDLRLLHSNTSSAEDLYSTDGSEPSAGRAYIDCRAPPPRLDLHELNDRMSRMGLPDRHVHREIPHVIEPTPLDLPPGFLHLSSSSSASSSSSLLPSPNPPPDAPRPYHAVTYPLANLHTPSSTGTQRQLLTTDEAPGWPPLTHSYSQGTILPPRAETSVEQRSPIFLPRDASYGPTCSTLPPSSASLSYIRRDTPPGLVPRGPDSSDALGQPPMVQHPYQRQADTRTSYAYPYPQSHHFASPGSFHSVPSHLSELPSHSHHPHDLRSPHSQHGQLSLSRQPPHSAQYHHHYMPEREPLSRRESAPHYDLVHHRENLSHIPPPSHPSYGYNYSSVGTSQSNGLYRRHQSVHVGTQSSLYQQAAAILPKCEDRILRVLQMHPQLTDLEQLVQLVQNLE